VIAFKTQKTLTMDNFTDFDGFNSFQKNFVKMAWDEYNSPQQNWTDLVLRYWTVIDERLGGKYDV
jgi:hypothetical protein